MKSVILPEASRSQVAGRRARAELDGGAGPERAGQSVDQAVNVVQGQRVEDPVLLRPRPGGRERGDLRRDVRVRGQHALGRARRAAGVDEERGVGGVGEGGRVGWWWVGVGWGLGRWGGGRWRCVRWRPRRGGGRGRPRRRGDGRPRGRVPVPGGGARPRGGRRRPGRARCPAGRPRGGGWGGSGTRFGRRARTRPGSESCVAPGSRFGDELSVAAGARRAGQGGSPCARGIDDPGQERIAGAVDLSMIHFRGAGSRGPARSRA